MKAIQFNLRRLFAAITLCALAIWIMNTTTPSPVLFIIGSIAIGALFGAAIGLLLNQLTRWTIIGALGWLVVGVYGVLA